ncbi:hypothetical protein DKX38_026967 [Salix brachista]|uniref:Uncharacterized protein n=1 Tax=Salix brachista TaxID=2182728 RepID=A0A5N5JAU5_9ROSI|nr:hypothetical protein DKX38_026967 [Salix brachista]
MLSSSMICSHLFTKVSGISVPSTNIAELVSFPCMPTTVLNHILLPFLPPNTSVNDLGPSIVFTPPPGSHSISIPRALALSHIIYDHVPTSALSDVPKASSQPLPLIDDVSSLLRAVKVYFSLFASTSSTASGNSSSILSVTLKLGTKGVCPPSGEDSYGKFLLGFLVFSAYKTKRHGGSQEIKLSLARTDQSGETGSLIGSPYAFVNVCPQPRPYVTNVIPAKGFDNIIKVLSILQIKTSKQNNTVSYEHLLCFRAESNDFVSLLLGSGVLAASEFYSGTISSPVHCCLFTLMGSALTLWVIMKITMVKAKDAFNMLIVEREGFIIQVSIYMVKVEILLLENFMREYATLVDSEDEVTGTSLKGMDVAMVEIGPSQKYFIGQNWLFDNQRLGYHPVYFLLRSCKRYRGCTVMYQDLATRKMVAKGISYKGDFGLAKLLNKEDHASTKRVQLPIRSNCAEFLCIGTPNYICVQNFLQRYLMDTNRAFGL